MWSLLMTLQFPQLCAACHAALQFSFSNETESKIVMLVEFVFSFFLPGVFRRLRETSSSLQAHFSLGLFHLNSERIPPRRVVVNCPQRLAAAGTRIFQSSTGRSPVSGKVLPDGKTLGRG